ncbi:histidinol dehydrogenase [candidate division KSB1 bacterium 4484_219]|nr:MAG: histidinol dehydrogenase [candidate division KSB1 bacterium 4484_219]
MIEIIEYSNLEKPARLEKILRRAEWFDVQIEQSVRSILADVKKDGDQAVLKYTAKWDGVSLTADELQVSDTELATASSIIAKELLSAIRQASENIRNYHEHQKPASWQYQLDEDAWLGEQVVPIERVGIYVPGGKAGYFSTVLMTAIPAKVAGVEKLVMITPPCEEGISPAILVAAQEAGVDEIFKVGGAQGIAALAYGTDTIPKVDKIVGPGNIYVTTAKKLVFGTVGIDSLAGPSEVVVVADNSANPQQVAAELLAQAEHDEMAMAICITTSPLLAEAVNKEMTTLIKKLNRREIIEHSLQEWGTIIIVPDLEKAIWLANEIAPEHLVLMLEDSSTLVKQIKNAGAIFLGSFSPVAVGDYFAGPSHVLPTAGTSRFSSRLGVDDFIKKISLVEYSAEYLHRYENQITTLARAENLQAHAQSVKIRCSNKK